MKKFLSRCLITFSYLFLAVFAFNYVKQDDYIYRSSPLPRDYVYEWKEPFEEIFIPVGEKSEINALHFHLSSPKGIVLFLHGQGKNLKYWGVRAPFFLQKGYDVLIIDYRGFGKSTKEYKQDYLLEDAEAAYKYLLNSFREDQIVIYGQSLGTAISTWLASRHMPKMLILEAPYYNMISAASHIKPFLPKWMIKIMLKYPLMTNEWIQNVMVPIYIFHGTADNKIPFVQAEMLFNEIKNHKKALMIELPDWGHHNIENNLLYQAKMADLL